MRLLVDRRSRIVLNYEYKSKDDDNNNNNNNNKKKKKKKKTMTMMSDVGSRMVRPV
jgi:hypothetical protein